MIYHNCHYCDEKYIADNNTEGCCSIRCALSTGRLEECPDCRNTGWVLLGELGIDKVRCSEGCDEDDWWVNDPDNPWLSAEDFIKKYHAELPDDDILF